MGDAFYLASTEAFGKPGVKVTLSIGKTPLPPPTLRWEYSTARRGAAAGWRPLTVVEAQDDG